MRDIYWQRGVLGAASYGAWLRDQGSLTRRIQQRCRTFSVCPMRSELARVAVDEAGVLGVAPDRLAFSREVFLCADAVPVVFAHSACAARDARGVWQAIRGLGNRSLGTLLFTHPQVKRHPLHIKKLYPYHPLYQSACAGRADRPAFLWARRSLFSLKEAPLLVTEVFLPEILQLNSLNGTHK